MRIREDNFFLREVGEKGVGQFPQKKNIPAQKKRLKKNRAREAMGEKYQASTFHYYYYCYYYNCDYY